MSTINSIATEGAVVASLQQQADAQAHEAIDAGKLYLVPDGAGGLTQIDTDDFAPSPRHEVASRVVTDAKSFVDYLTRHVRPGTEVFAHTATSSVVGVIDSHEATGGANGWQKHRVRLELEHTKSWLAWTSHDLGTDERAWFDQAGFADFIEQNALDVRVPEHGTLIDIATTFEAKQKADFGSAVRQQDGSVKFEYSETIAAKAGQKGELTIPKELELAVRPYIGGPIYKLIASFRYRIGGNGLRLGYALQRPEVILEAAFTDIVQEIKDGRHDKGEWPDHPGIGEVPIFSGKPA